MKRRARTQVAIIGAGPAGLLLGQLLSNAGIDNVILENRSRDYVLARVRAGVLEEGTTRLVDQAGVGARMRERGLVHDGINLAFAGGLHTMDFRAITGRYLMVYGQTELTRDLIEAREGQGLPLVFEAEAVTPTDFESRRPQVSWRTGGVSQLIESDFIVGCDGFHGVSRRSVPSGAITTFEHAYDFGWLGVLADVPPIPHGLTYSNHPRGFALCSKRSHTRSRYYIQLPLTETLQDWSDDRFWDELVTRLPPEVGASVTRGPSIEKSIAPLRSFVAEPLRFGRLFLAGDAGHIVPPTGAKGLNLAASDVHYLFEGLREYYAERSEAGIDDYSQRALARVWKVQRFASWMTRIMHKFPADGQFGQRLQEAELANLMRSAAAATAMAENYVGLPY